MANRTSKNNAHWRRNTEIPMEPDTAAALKKKRAAAAPASEEFEKLKAEHAALLEATEIWKEGIKELGALRKENTALKEQAAQVDELRSRLVAAAQLEKSLTETRDAAVEKIKDLEGKLTEAEELQKFDLKALLVENVKLNNSLADSQRQVMDLEAIQQAAEKNVNYWRYVLPEKKPRMPKIGEKVLCLCVNIREYGERLADRRNKDLGSTYYKELYYSGEYAWKGLANGHIVVAWRPSIVHDKEKINIAVMDIIMQSLAEPPAFQKIFSFPERQLSNPDYEKKRLDQLRKDLRAATNKKISQIFETNNKLARDVLNVIRKDNNGPTIQDLYKGSRGTYPVNTAIPRV